MSINQRTRKLDVSRFAMVPRSDVPRSVFRAQSSLKTTLNSSYLVPVYVDEVLPGDSFRIGAHGFARMSTPIAPLMDNIWLDWFWFFVPYRLVWSNFIRFMGERTNIGDSVDYLVPQIESPVGGYAIGSVYDYMGLPTVGQVEAASVVAHSALPLRAYARIFHDWFKDENLTLTQTATLVVDDGPDLPSEFALLRRMKRHDYFTASLPWPAKPIAPLDASGAGVGGPSNFFTRLDIGAPVHGLGLNDPISVSPTGANSVAETGRSPFQVTYASSVDVNALVAGEEFLLRLNGEGYPEIRVLIEGIRQAATFQHLMELDARGGTRYTEIVRAHFGVVSPDARLQRSEYLGGGSQPVNVNPVAQTSESTVGNALGDLGATATSFGGSSWSQSFTEHGVVLGLVSIRPDLTYQQGIRRFWKRLTKYDFYWPALANLGEQAVMSAEIYCTGESGDTNVFGYQERWAEYKFVPSMITGRFRSTATGTLDLWHAAQRFTGRPTLNEAFMIQSPIPDRVLAEGAGAAAGNQEFLLDCFFEVSMVRAMPAFGTPGLLRL